MLPLQDVNPTRRVPVITYGLIAANVLVFLWTLSFNERDLFNLFRDLSVVPANFAQFGLTGSDNIVDLFRSMFFHGGWAHLLGNMLYLWIFGDNIEDRFGIIVYLALYFLSGIGAALAQVLIDPSSPIPLVGASGAIAGILGGYAVLFPGVKVRGLIFFGYFGRITELPALAVLGFWFVLQLVSGVGVITTTTQGGGVAFFAHVGGFVAGAVLTLILMRIIPMPDAHERVQRVYDRRRY